MAIEVNKQLMGWVKLIEFEQETIKHPPVASGCVIEVYATKYKNTWDTIFYKIPSYHIFMTV